jgi:glycosyltransferase involved in cell wall biosynthesis
MYPFLVDKCFVVGNGLDASRFDGAEVRGEHRFVYASSPDRGLEQALNYWPKIKEALPDAEFHIYYGWQNYERMNAPREYQRHIMELAQQPGVVWRGRVGQQQLAKELMQSSVLFYPGPHTFNETFCIAALEAQAAGCVPVTRDNGALPETNSRGVLVPNDASPEEWVDAAVKATGTHDRRRTFLHEWAITQSWALVADRLLAKVRAMAKAA